MLFGALLRGEVLAHIEGKELHHRPQVHYPPFHLSTRVCSWGSGVGVCGHHSAQLFTASAISDILGWLAGFPVHCAREGSVAISADQKQLPAETWVTFSSFFGDPSGQTAWWGE